MKRDKVDHFFASFGAILAILFLAAVALIGVALFSNMQKFYIPFILVIAGLMIVVVILSNIQSIARHRFFPISVKLCLGLFVGIAIGYHIDRAYDHHLIVSEQDVNVDDYRPFADHSKVATLDSPSTYTLSAQDQLPVLDGATALYPLYSAFVKAVYPAQDYEPDDTKSIVRITGTGKAYQRLINHNVDMIFAAAPSKQQQKAAQAKGLQLNMQPIGREAFVFFVHKNNPVHSLTSTQIKQIYTGEITNWKQVGGNDDPIRAFQRPEDSGSQAMLRRWMGDQQPMTPIVDDVASGMGGIIEQTADYRNYKNAIGYSFHYFATQMNANDDIRLLAIDGVYPDVASIRNKQYPIITPFYAITTSSNRKTDTTSSVHPNIQPFLNWILSEQGQQLVKKTGYFPIR